MLHRLRMQALPCHTILKKSESSSFCYQLQWPATQGIVIVALSDTQSHSPAPWRLSLLRS